MNRQVLKFIAGGALIGAALYWMPFFVLKVLVIFAIIGLIFRLFGRRRYWGPAGWGYADKIRTMSDQEYADFKKRFAEGRCGYHSDQKKNKSNE